MKITQQVMRMRLVMLVLTIAAAAAEASSLAAACQTECGGVSIPYPFGIGDGCFRPGFEVRCNKTANGSSILYKPLIDDSQVILITLFPAEVRLYAGINFDCSIPHSGLGFGEYVAAEIWAFSDPYRLSYARNKFTGVGCNTIAYMGTFNVTGPGHHFLTGCLSSCDRQSQISDGSCSGVGCCQIPIPEDLRYYRVTLGPTTFGSFIDWRSQNACSFAFLADEEGYQFKASDTNISNAHFGNNNGLMPITLDWAIRNETSCEEAHSRNKLGTNTSYACLSEHSQCIDSTNGAGYTCNCSAGYQGNPYLQGGCQDINECDFPDKYPCFGVCTNVPGNYSCSCSAGHQGNAYLRGGCYPDGWGVGKIFIIGTCVAIGILLLLLTGALLWKMLKKRNVRRRKDKFYRQNRGLLLQQLISSDETLVERLKIFDLEELEKATNNFDSTRVVGGGGHGTVYKGILSDQRVVAIKKSKIAVQSEIDQFINEVVILSQINHRSVVKLFGCCLESQVPLLVYEFISGGTLFNLLHSVDKITAISLDDRLRIAREIAGALAYLHSAASISIFHRDVKTSNVLINENYTAKVSDFGASRSLPFNQTRITTVVQGTFGYLDPEYFQTGQLTEKSDVYSFGVILVELLTRQLPVSRGRLEELEGNLSKRFIDSFKKGCLFQILDPQVLAEGSKEEIEEIARIADMCLRLKGEERPTMKEVERRLDSMRNFGKQKYDPGALLRHGSRTDMQRDASIEDNATTSSTRQYSLQQEFLLMLELPR